MTAHPDLCVTVGVVDRMVSDDGVMLPGLGDSGDRLFGTSSLQQDDESLVHPSKRKRSDSAAQE
jgi:hypothetical protein